jgi:hypothetical protein
MIEQNRERTYNLYMSNSTSAEWSKNSPYASIEEYGGRYEVYNDVTGLLVGSYLIYKQAVGQVDIIHKYYSAIER